MHAELCYVGQRTEVKQAVMQLSALRNGINDLKRGCFMRTEHPTDTPGLALSPAPADLILDDVLFDRSADTTALHCEIAAVRELSRILSDEQGALLRFLCVGQSVCNAGSAGVSAVQNDGVGKRSIRWRAIAGALSSHEGKTVPRDFSTCGMCLDHEALLVLERPQRVFSYLNGLPPAVSELLIVPLYADDAAIGTLWFAHHGVDAHFSSDDARVAERLALHLVWALERLQSNDEHRRALSERETLVRDAHHRVANTLQIAASALRTPSGVVAQGPTRTAFDRLQALGRVHTALAVTGEDTVFIRPLLQTIVDAVSSSYMGMSHDVRVSLDADDVALPGDRAVALALWLNEALTNACKHAFPDGRRGQIAISVRARGYRLSVRIADDGAGFVSGRGEGLGLRLLEGLAKQLGGSSSLERPTSETGTILTLSFPADFVTMPTALLGMDVSRGQVTANQMTVHEARG